MAIDIDASHYNTGTATVAGTAVTGQGTTWLGTIRKGDLFGTHKGSGVRIASVDSNTSLTLAYAVPALEQTAAPYEIQRTPFDVGYYQALENLLVLLGGGNLEAFAGLNGLSGKLPMFTGPATLDLISKFDLVSGVKFDVQVADIAARAVYDTQAAGFAVLVGNTGDGRSAIYSKVSNTSGDWSAPSYLTGPSITLDVTQVDEVPYGTPPEVNMTPRAGGYDLAFDIPRGMIIEPGTTTTLAPDQPAAVTFVPIAGGYRLDIAIPRGPTGDIDGVTPFWVSRLGSDADAAAARAGLGAVGSPATAGNLRIAVFDGDGNRLKDGGKTLDELSSSFMLDIRKWPVSEAAANNSPAIQAAMQAAADAGLPLYVGEANTVWPCTDIVAPNIAGKTLTLVGTPTFAFSGSGFMDLSGTITDVGANITATVTKGARSITVASVSGLAVGDYVIVENQSDFSFSPSQHTGREAYHAGDYNRIRSISGTTVTFERALRDSYVVGNKCYKVQPVTLKTDAFKVVASNTPLQALLVNCAVNSEINAHARGGSARAAMFARMWLSTAVGGVYFHDAPDSGTNYGLVVSNAQDCNFYPEYAYGTRRGIATGTGGGIGGICMRNVWVIGGASDNATDVLGSADLHGDADNCGFIDHAATFFDLGGRSPKIKNCAVTPRGEASPVAWTEIAGGQLTVDGLTVTRGVGSTYNSIVSGRNGAQLAAIKENYSVSVTNVTVATGAGLLSGVSFYHAAASPVGGSVFVDKINILSGAVDAAFAMLRVTVGNPASHPSVAAPVSAYLGNNCSWPSLNTHSWIVTSGSPLAGCRLTAPPTTFATSFTVQASSNISVDQVLNFIRYPFSPTAECQPYGLASAAGSQFYGMIATVNASSVQANITTGNSSVTAGAVRTLNASVRVSMEGMLHP